MARLVPGLSAARGAGRRRAAGERAGESPVLVALGGHADERPANPGAELRAGWDGGQAYECKMDLDRQMPGGYGAAGYQ